MKPACGSKAADGAARGAIIGLAWGLVFDSFTTPLHRNGARFRAIGAVATSFGASVCRSSIGFSVFLGIYNGVNCAAENLRRKRDFLNPMVGGFAAGSCAGASSGSRRIMIASALGTGLITSLASTIFGTIDGCPVEELQR